MEKYIFVIYADCIDDACEFKGYIYGTSDDAEAYCNEINKDIEWPDYKYTWIALDCLNAHKPNNKRRIRVTHPDSAEPGNDPNLECPSECQLQ